MVLYYCEICGKPFDQKGNYLRHKKIHKVVENVSVVETAIECQYCKKIFKHNGTLKHHIEYKCKYAPNQLLKDTEQTFEIKLAKMEARMEEKIDKLNQEKNELERRLTASLLGNS